LNPVSKRVSRVNLATELNEINTLGAEGR